MLFLHSAHAPPPLTVQRLFGYRCCASGRTGGRFPSGRHPTLGHGQRRRGGGDGHHRNGSQGCEQSLRSLVLLVALLLSYEGGQKLFAHLFFAGGQVFFFAGLLAPLPLSGAFSRRFVRR